MTLTGDMVSWLTDTLVTYEGLSATYSRGATSAAVTVIKDGLEYERDTYADEGLTLRVKRASVLIKRSTFPAALVTPEAGDFIDITGTQSGVSGTDRYEVLSIGGEPVWRFTDGTEHLMRINVSYLVTN